MNRQARPAAHNVFTCCCNVNTARGHIDRGWQPDAVNRQFAAVNIADNCDRREDLVKIKMPVPVIHGNIDPIVTIPSGRELAASIPDSRLCIIPGTGHDLSLNFLDQIVDSIFVNMKRLKYI